MVISTDDILSPRFQSASNIFSERPKTTSLFVVLASLCVPSASVLKPALRTSYLSSVGSSFTTLTSNLPGEMIAAVLSPIKNSSISASSIGGMSGVGVFADGAALGTYFLPKMCISQNDDGQRSALSARVHPEINLRASRQRPTPWACLRQIGLFRTSPGPQAP